MNVLLNNLRCSTYVINNLIKNVNVTFTRGIKSDLKIKWIRPPKIPSTLPEKSGDGGLDHNISNNDLLLNYEESQELQSASDIVKKMFCLEFNPIRDTYKKNHDLTVGLVKQHTYDIGSFEVSLASMTNEILYLQEYMIRHPRNKKTKHYLKELIDRRKKLLNKLRKWDCKKFEWILEKLNLTFKPFPRGHIRIERKASLRKLTALHCEKIRQERLDNYKMELNDEQKIFFKDKVKQLEFIRDEEIACGVTPTISEEEIEAAREKAAQYSNK